MLVSLWGPRTDAIQDVADAHAADGLLPQRPEGAERRGVTALEYMVCASAIICVVILAVQHIGSITKSMFSDAASKTTTAKSDK